MGIILRVSSLGARRASSSLDWGAETALCHGNPILNSGGVVADTVARSSGSSLADLQKGLEYGDQNSLEIRDSSLNLAFNGAVSRIDT